MRKLKDVIDLIYPEVPIDETALISNLDTTLELLQFVPPELETLYYEDVMRNLYDHVHINPDTGTWQNTVLQIWRNEV